MSRVKKRGSILVPFDASNDPLDVSTRGFFPREELPADLLPLIHADPADTSRYAASSRPQYSTIVGKVQQTSPFFIGKRTRQQVELTKLLNNHGIACEKILQDLGGRWLFTLQEEYADVSEELVCGLRRIGLPFEGQPEVRREKDAPGTWRLDTPKGQEALLKIDESTNEVRIYRPGSDERDRLVNKHQTLIARVDTHDAHKIDVLFDEGSYLIKRLGTSLGVVSKERLEKADAKNVASNMAHLLGSMHALGVVHGHPHPNNFVLMGESGSDVGVFDMKKAQRRAVDWGGIQSVYNGFEQDYFYLNKKTIPYLTQLCLGKGAKLSQQKAFKQEFLTQMFNQYPIRGGRFTQALRKRYLLWKAQNATHPLEKLMRQFGLYESVW